MAPPFDVRLIASRLAVRFQIAFGGCGFHDDISVEALIEDRFVSSIRCCIPLSFSEYHISGEVKRQG
jgi:hypothetical protein